MIRRAAASNWARSRVGSMVASARAGALARRIASVVKVHHLVVAGTSNWGAYGVVAELSVLAGRPLLHSADEERKRIGRDLHSLINVDGRVPERVRSRRGDGEGQHRTAGEKGGDERWPCRPDHGTTEADSPSGRNSRGLPVPSAGTTQVSAAKPYRSC